MIDLDFEKRLRAAARASVDRIPVPPAPGSLLRLRAGAAPRRASAWWWAAAASVAIGLAGATDGGRTAVARVVEHTMNVFSIDPETGKHNTMSAISLQEALSTGAFRVVEPRGLPVGTTLVAIHRLGEPETGRAAVLFQYARGGRPFEILESGVTKSGPAESQVVRASSAMLPESHQATVKVNVPRTVLLFRSAQTAIVVTSGAGALTNTQLDAIRRAMTRS